MTPVICSCERCQGMCNNSTCLPTPEEARALMRAGYADRLTTYQFNPDPNLYRAIGPAPAEKLGQRNLWSTLQGRCTFYKEGLCELHDLRLKPLEGRLAHHDRAPASIRLKVLTTWKGKQFESVEKMLDRYQGETP